MASFVGESPSPIIRLCPDGELVSFNRGAADMPAVLPGPDEDPGAKVSRLFEGCLQGGLSGGVRGYGDADRRSPLSVPVH